LLCAWSDGARHMYTFVSQGTETNTTRYTLKYISHHGYKLTRFLLVDQRTVIDTPFFESKTSRILLGSSSCPLRSHQLSSFDGQRRKITGAHAAVRKRHARRDDTCTQSSVQLQHARTVPAKRCGTNPRLRKPPPLPAPCDSQTSFSPHKQSGKILVRDPARVQVTHHQPPGKKGARPQQHRAIDPSTLTLHVLCQLR
jgi:hypothetical protein